MIRKRVEPPGGWPPPTHSRYEGRDVALVALAEEVADRHLATHPDDVETYGEEMARRWCVHDVQHILNWALDEFVNLERQVGWLAGVLEARGYPLGNLADCLEITAGVTERHIGAPPAADLRAAAAALRRR